MLPAATEVRGVASRGVANAGSSPPRYGKPGANPRQWTR